MRYDLVSGDNHIDLTYCPPGHCQLTGIDIVTGQLKAPLGIDAHRPRP